MEISNKLKDTIFKKLYKELSKVEIIPYNDSIWFIDRKNKYWYFEYENDGTLWWRHSFFDNFFVWFSVERYYFEPIISEWVEEVLNCKVNTTCRRYSHDCGWVEEVLNCKVNTTGEMNLIAHFMVEEVLNCEVTKTHGEVSGRTVKINEVLNGNRVF